MRTQTLFLALVVGLAGATDAWAQKPAHQESRWERLKRLYARGEASAAARLPGLAGAVVTETEPNDLASQANRARLEDQANGEVNPAGDVDFYVFSVPAGTTLDLDVDASQMGSPLDPVLWLYDRDGTTVLAYNDDHDGLDSRIVRTIAAAGDYFAAVSGYAGQGGSGYTYTLRIGTRTPGPGDPTTVLASGLAGPVGMAFDETGNLFVTELFARRVSRIAPGGGVSVVAENISFPVHVVIDGYGNLLVTSDDGNVYRISSDGSRTRLISGLGLPFWLAIGPDGSLWVADPAQQLVLRYDPFGRILESFDASGLGGAFFLAFSPAGELYFSTFFEIYRLVNRQPQLFLASGRVIDGFAFDVEGNLYVASESADRVTLYAPDGSVLADPFAFSNFSDPVNVAFGREPDGRTNARLFVADITAGALFEANPAGVRAPGWPVTVALLRMASPSLRDGVMGAEYADTLRVTDDTVTPTWSIVSGALPPGLALAAATGVLSGVPEATGEFAFRVRVEAGSRFGEAEYSITVTAPALSIGNVADQLLGIGGALTPEQVRYVDLLGNRNGRLDVGDLRAFLQSVGALASVASTP